MVSARRLQRPAPGNAFPRTSVAGGVPRAEDAAHSRTNLSKLGVSGTSARPKPIHCYRPAFEAEKAPRTILFASQCLNRLNAGGPARGQVAGQQSYQTEQDRNRSVGEWIREAHFEQKARHQSSQSESGS